MGKYVRGSGKTGRINMKKVAGGWMNQHGVIITDAERKAHRKAEKQSNQIREKQIVELEKLRPEATQLRLMGKESDFIITRQSKSLQSFKSKADYEKYMDKQARIQSGEYLDDRTKLYKSNYMKAIDNVFGGAGSGVKMKIRMMKPADFRQLVEKLGDEMEIGYIYDPIARIGKLNKIRSLLGMRELEEDPFDEE